MKVFAHFNQANNGVFLPLLTLTLFFLVNLHSANAQTGHSPNAEEAITEIFINEFGKQPMIQKLMGENPKIVESVTALKTFGADPENPSAYQAIVELGLKMPDGSISYAYFSRLLKIFNLTFKDGKPVVEDVTSLGLPSKKLWAHYKVSTGPMKTPIHQFC